MSKETAQDFASAALRHVRDARFLLDGCDEYSSPDQAWHLAGFGPECIRKACLASRDWDKVLGHSLGAINDGLMDMIVDMEPGVTRYRLNDIVKVQIFKSWSPESRYKSTGYITPLGIQRKNHVKMVDCVKLLQEAELYVKSLNEDLWMDGVLTKINDREV